MTNRSRMYTIIAIIGTVFLAALLVDIFWLIPSLHNLRTTIDNDRASTAVITQQQSNLAQLTQDVASIQSKETELETNVWTFLKEDTFFSTIDTIAKTKSILIDPPTIADATPTGAILPRAVTMVLHGKINNVLSAVNAIQSFSPLIAIQQLSIVTDAQPGNVQLTLTATTLWK